MTPETDTEKMAQALRELLDSHDHAVECDYANQRAADEREAAARVAARELLAAHDTARAQPASVPDDYVAWLRYQYHDGDVTTIHVCDSDDDGAFRVYREPQAQPASVAHPPEPARDANNKAWTGGEKAHFQAAAELVVEREQTAKDAARYRWLRQRVRWNPMPEETQGAVYLVATMVSAVYGDTNDQTDAAIDAAMAQEPGDE